MSLVIVRTLSNLVREEFRVMSNLFVVVFEEFKLSKVVNNDFSAVFDSFKRENAVSRFFLVSSI